MSIINNITYYRATEKDIDLCIDLRITFLSEYWGEQSKEVLDPFRNYFKKYLEHAIPENKYICFIAKSENTIAGVGGMAIREQPGSFRNPSGRVGYILSMYTVPELRKQGICTKLIELLTSTGKETNITAFELHATEEGEPVYQKCGFLKHGEPTYRKYLV